MGETLLKQLPQALGNPVAIISSQTQPGRVVAILQVQHNGNNIVAPVEIDGFGTQNSISIDSNAVTSVFGKSNAVTKLLNDAIISEINGNTSVFYLNKKEAASLMQAPGLQLPNHLPDNGFVHSITDTGSNVKKKFENVTQTQQFKRWFGDWENDPSNASKVVNEDGTPKIVYHGTENFGFTAFDLNKMDDKRSIFLTDNLDVAQTYSGVDEVRRLSDYNPSDVEKVSDMGLEALVDALNKNADEDVHYEVFRSEDLNLLKADVDSGVKRLVPVIDRKLNEYSEILKWTDEQVYSQVAEEMHAIGITDEDSLLWGGRVKLYTTGAERAYKQLELIKEKLSYGDYEMISTPLYMLLNHTKVFSEGEKETFGKLESNIRKLKQVQKADVSDDVIIRNYGDGYKYDIYDKQFAIDLVKDIYKWGIYGLYVDIKNPLVIEANGGYWNDLGYSAPDGKVLNKTREIAQYAYNNGYDGVEFRNIRDNGGKGHAAGNSTVYVAFSPEQIKSATDNIGTFDGNNADIRYSRKEFDVSEKSDIDAYTYETLTRKSDMPVTIFETELPTKNNGQIDRKSILDAAINNVRIKNNPKNTDTNSYIRVKDINKDILVSKDKLRHGLTHNSDTTALSIMNIGDVLENAIAVNELVPRANTNGSYVLMGIGTDNTGAFYPTRIIVNNYSVEKTEPLSVIYAVKTKKDARSGFPAGLTENTDSLARTSSVTTISDFLDVVKNYFPDTLSQEVLDKYGIDRPYSSISESVRYSKKNVDTDTNNVEAVDSENLTLSQLFTNSMQKEHYSSEFKAEAEKRKSAFEYEKINNKDTYTSAQQHIDSVGAEKALNELYSRSSWSANDTAVALALVEKFNDNKDYSSAVDVFALMRKHATQAGQALQALRMIDYLTPEGQYMLLQREHKELIKKQVERMPKERQEQFYKDYKEAVQKDRQEARQRRLKKQGEQLAVDGDRPVFVPTEPEPVRRPSLGDEPVTENGITTDNTSVSGDETTMNDELYGDPRIDLELREPHDEDYYTKRPEEGIKPNVFKNREIEDGDSYLPEWDGVVPEDADAYLDPDSDVSFEEFFDRYDNDPEFRAWAMHDFEQDKLDIENSEAEEYSKRTHVDDLLDLYNIFYISGDQFRAYSKILYDIDELDTADDLIHLIMNQSKMRKTVANKSVERALMKEDITMLKDIAVQQVFGMLADMSPKSAARKASTVQTVAQLLNSRTMLRNVVSNFAFNRVDKMASNTAAIIDSIFSIFTKQRSLAYENMIYTKGGLAANKQGARRSYLDIALDVQTSAAGSKYNGLETSRRTFKGRNPVAGAERLMSYGLTVTDEWMKSGIEHDVIQAYTKLRDKGRIDMTDEQIKEYAQSVAKYRTFQDDSVVAQLLTGLKDVLNVVGVGDTKQQGSIKSHEFGMGDIVQKYARVPGNLVTRFLEYSPTGYMKAIWDICSVMDYKRRGGKFNAEQQSKIATTLGRAITGSGFTLAFYYLAKKGIFTGEREDESKTQIEENYIWNPLE